MVRTDLSLPRGIRDIEPEEYEVQAKIQAEFEEVARLFNFRMMEPAPLEHLSTLRAKSGEDVDKEIYAFKDKGDRDVGLRFDLTVGMTRYVCSRRDLRPPVKLASVAGAWRYDEPQHARYRWFRQWDLEIFGGASVDADAEVMEATFRLFERLFLKGFRIMVGDRTTVQHFVNSVLGIKSEEKAVEVMRALDKVQKRSLSDLKTEYSRKGFKATDIERLFEFGKLEGKPEKVLRELDGYKLDTADLSRLADSLKSRGVKDFEFSLGVVRGIDYYTGIVFEVVDGEHPDLGSLAGGGRYDLLPKAFGRPDLSATGAAGGMERIALSLSRERVSKGLLVFVASAGERLRDEALRVASQLRSGGIASEVSLQDRSLAKQLEDANKSDAAWTLIVGEKEVASGKVKLRNMKNGAEELVTMAQALALINQS